MNSSHRYPMYFKMPYPLTMAVCLSITIAFSQEASPGEENRAARHEAGEQWKSTSGPERIWEKILQSFLLKPTPAKAGKRAYVAEDYATALRKYTEAGFDHPGSQSLAYNTGNVHYRQGRFDDAARHFEEALKGTNATLAANAYYNLGNVFFRKGEAAGEGGAEKALAEFREALAHYKKSLEIKPENAEAKRNIEVTQARIKELLEQQQQDPSQGGGEPPPEPSERAKQILARAMQLSAQRKYSEAKSLLEAIIREDETAASFKSHVQRIQDVLDLLSGKMPTPPESGDPRARQEGLGVI